MLIDTHCHLEKSDYDNIEEVINNMNNNIMIVCSENLETAHNVVELSKTYDNIYGTIGFHPNELDNFNEQTLKELEELLKNDKIVGIGEIGLDYHYGKDDCEIQKEAFIKQIELAIKYNLPIVVHSRDAAYDTLEILKKYPNLKIDMHCYGYSLEIAKELLTQNVKFGIGGVLTFKNSKIIKEVVDYLDLKDILLETDSPFLAPEPVRGTKNEPSNVKYIAEYIAKLKNIDIKKVKEITTNNAISQFDLKLKK